MVKLPETLLTTIVASLHFMNSVCQTIFTKNQLNKILAQYFKAHISKRSQGTVRFLITVQSYFGTV